MPFCFKKYSNLNILFYLPELEFPYNDGGKFVKIAPLISSYLTFCMILAGKFLKNLFEQVHRVTFYINTSHIKVRSSITQVFSNVGKFLFEKTTRYHTKYLNGIQYTDICFFSSLLYTTLLLQKTLINTCFC